MIRRRVPGITDRFSDDDVLGAFQFIVFSMVSRVFRNPAGARQTSQTVGPFAVSQTVGDDRPGELHLTDAELSELAGTAPQGAAFTIDQAPAYSGTPPRLYL